MDSIRYLRDNVTVMTADDATPFLASAARARRPGSALLVFLGPGRRFFDMLVVEGGDEILEELVELTCSADEPEVEALFIATDRTGDVPADRPHDELRWLELCDLAAQGETNLLDWFVLWDWAAFSVAEFAPAPAGW